MDGYIPILLEPISPPFGAFHHQTSYIPNQTSMYGQFSYNITPKPPFVNTVQPTPQSIDPNTNQSQENVAIGESEAQSSHWST